MIQFILVSLLLTATTVFAGESGYIKNGETHVVFKDGKKVGEWPAGAAKQRLPAAAYSTDTPFYYQDDGFARCYSLNFGTITTGTISCVKN